ncbi:MAG: hypothetical protein KME64_01800 [Scytonematopsis contorta HA4267-MV1]|jgi:hypothetical protein|nr:hypothetical protein [Scytonematopsis contorta HA4267-MV1]
MSNHLNFSKIVSLVSTSLVASSVVISSPCYAATFALSQSTFKFVNFNQIPEDIFTNGNTNTVTLASNGNGNVTANADANALFDTARFKASNLSRSTASGTGKHYLGLAESVADLKGIFKIAENTTFSFDFTADLNLEASIDNPAVESAKANGNIFFGLFDADTNTLFDFFSLRAGLNTSNNSDFLNFDTSDKVTVKDSITMISTGSKKESTQASIQGFFKRTFANKINLALVEFKRNEARVTVPESSGLIALLFCSGVVSISLRRKK